MTVMSEEQIENRSPLVKDIENMMKKYCLKNRVRYNHIIIIEDSVSCDLGGHYLEK